MKSNIFRLIMLALVNVFILVCAIIFGMDVFIKKELSFWNFLALAFSLVIVILLSAFILQNYKKMKNGMPLENERTERIITHSAAKSFYISIYWFFAIALAEKYLAKMFDATCLTAPQTVSIGIAGMAFIFLIAWIYYERKGRIN